MSVTVASRVAAICATLSLTAIACSGPDPIPGTSGPTTVLPPSEVAEVGVLTLRIGAVTNASAPAADVDRRIVRAFDAAASQLSGSTVAKIEPLTINDVDDVAAAVLDLSQRGVTVVIGTCDEATTGALLKAAATSGLLAVTGCASLPAADLGEPGALFFDLASLHDSAAVMADYAIGEGLSRAAVIRSTLVNDVAETCLDFEAAFPTAGGTVALSDSFAGLVETPDLLTDSAVDQLADIDLFAVCALPAALNETVATIRAAGYEQPIVVPWFGADTTWSAETTNVFVLAVAAADDPATTVVEFFALADSTRSTDVVSADVIHRLVGAADRAASVGARRLETVLLAEELDGATGRLTVDAESRQTVGRAYRVVEVAAGQESFVTLISADR